MITFERTSVMNMENAMRGARNPLNSWARGDSYVNDKGEFIFGENDLQLAKRLYPPDFYYGGYYRTNLLVEGV